MIYFASYDNKICYIYRSQNFTERCLPGWNVQTHLWCFRLLYNTPPARKWFHTYASSLSMNKGVFQSSATPLSPCTFIQPTVFIQPAGDRSVRVLCMFFFFAVTRFSALTQLSHSIRVRTKRFSPSDYTSHDQIRIILGAWSLWSLQSCTY